MSILARMKADFREFPATTGLGALWVLIFLMMAADQAAGAGGLSPGNLVLGLRYGHWFGDMTLRELYAGELWRAVTATFVHYGLLHIVMNLYALYQLGCVVESWYGPGPFVAIYVLTGGGGNLISAWVRNALHSNPAIASGGGSTVVMGLVALCAVVGWNSGTPIGDLLRKQMVWVLALTAAIGMGFSAAGVPVIDNWGHTGGAVVGALIGLANRPLLRYSGGLAGRASGVLGVAVLAACAVAQASDDRAEAVDGRRAVEQARRRWADAEQLLTRLEEIRQLYRAVAAPRAVLRGALVREVPRRPAPPPATQARPAPAPARADPEQELYQTVLNASFRSLGSMGRELDSGPNSADFRAALQILAQTIGDVPTLEEVREFDARVLRILDRLRRTRDLAREQAGVRIQVPSLD